MTINADPMSDSPGAVQRTAHQAAPVAQPGLPVAGDELDASADGALRASTYAMLGALMTGAPDEAMLERLRAIAAPQQPQPQPQSLRTGDERQNLTQSWSALRQAAEVAEPEPLGHEYQDLFIGLGRGQVVPFGSWYMTGFMMDQPLANLREDLATLGFERLNHVKEPEDHAGALLETMAFLASEGEHPTTQRRFFERHMAPWMKTFFKDMQNAPAAKFYQAVGAFGECFITFEQKYLSMQA